MDETDLRLDGNAVAGLLAEVFALEATTALVRCAGCGHDWTRSAPRPSTRTAPGSWGCAAAAAPACSRGSCTCPTARSFELRGLRRLELVS